MTRPYMPHRDRRRRRLALFALLLTALLPAALLSKTAPSELPATQDSEAERARHALNRLAFGPRPGQVEGVARDGVGDWIRRQLRPGPSPRLPQEGSSAGNARPEPLEARLAAHFPTLRLSTAQLYERYPPRNLTRRRLKAQGLAPEEIRDHLRSLRGRDSRRVLQELALARLLRAVEAEDQLREVMVDFWANHFNVHGRRDPTPLLLVAWEEEVLRPHALGRFGDLLEATARGPAMLFYLDNWRSTAPDPRGRSRRGLNENYARELLELHTLGVDGGYDEGDVREVARCFTGWSFQVPRPGPESMGSIATMSPGDGDGPGGLPAGTGRFVFRGRLHDGGAKTVLGRTLPAGGGIGDGLKVLDLLARHPATARHISRKLAVRFVADEPPEALVDRMAAVFLETEGDIPAVLETLFFSPEFWSAEARRAKVKTPFELAVSALRASGARVFPSPVLLRRLQALGETPYGAVPPTGYPDTAADWLAPGALVERLNFALSLAADRLPGARLPEGGTPADRQQAGRLLTEILGEEISPSTRAAVLGVFDESESFSAARAGAEALGLILGSPEFQRQ